MKMNANNSTNGIADIDDEFDGKTLKRFQEAFNFFDIDHDGRITVSELQSVLKFLGNHVSDKDVELMIKDADVDGNGTVEYPEFLIMMKRYTSRHPNEPALSGTSEDLEMWEAFRAFDHNGDCLIDFNEIKRTMHFLGEKVSDSEVKAMIREADVDNDGFINFEEFKMMMLLVRQKSS